MQYYLNINSTYQMLLSCPTNGIYFFVSPNVVLLLFYDFSFFIAANDTWAAAKRAMGILKGEQET
jgi:hypothetical protein